MNGDPLKRSHSKDREKSSDDNQPEEATKKKRKKKKIKKAGFKDKKMNALVSQWNKVTKDLNPLDDKPNIQEIRRQEATERWRKTQETSHSADNPNLVPVGDWRKRVSGK